MDLEAIATYQTELTLELKDLLHWWSKYTVDEENGGFFGQVNNNNVPDPKAAKGLVLNTRILYTFSAAYALLKKEDDLRIADRAFHYITTYFNDPTNGGFYWSVDAKGQKLDGKKQVYGQAFAIYALAEYVKVTKNQNALSLARNTFYLLEKHSFDRKYSGYLEAHTQDWNILEDLRLSDKDQNEKKSMNTHLHVVEAYANLYLVWKDEELKKVIQSLLGNFKTHLIHPENHHLQLFFTEKWEVKSELVSFGHDIEAAWLLQEAAECIRDEEAIALFKQLALKMTDAATKGLDKNGGLWYEYDLVSQHWIKEFHWWPQAEAMVGFFNAWQINKDDQYLLYSLRSWTFIKNYLKDDQKGEWHWGINSDYSLMQGQDKAGFWKCPYHNGRACLEIIKRINGNICNNTA